ncbi:procollagen-lysine,2-oxoglutarate 5-dioxygenase 1-like isoform X2 [Eriocheir sinensis]|uniref:procollagen-lysine,2-oxoglutarate 5-dioxygenase 1-like isoform X2 n=1 Tax=Eriocheir sinensis TaxID=95602 RepID=UPI0021CAAE07|nr:procollagen-lysine,2-oxoglutarate 5-dioxygenase 1-like isoform X2 [Eriocheir sinensis]
MSPQRRWFNVSPLPLLSLLCLALTPLVEAGADVTMGVAYEDVTSVGGGVRACVEGAARGEDGVNYCRKLTPQETLKLKQGAEDLVVLTIRRPGDDAFKRFLRSARVYGYKVKVLGEEGEGVEEEVGGRRRIQLLQEALALLKEEKEDRLVLYTESVDVVLSGGPVRVVEEMGEADDVDVWVAGDTTCWPDRNLDEQFPKVEKGKRFLNSGGFVGKVSVLNKLFTEEGKEEMKNLEKKKKEKKEEEEKTEEEEEDDKHALQILFNRVYLKESLRRKYKIEIDHAAKVFQNLNDAVDEVDLQFSGREGYLLNLVSGSVPIVIRGNGHAHLILNTLGAYLARAWNPEDGCRACWEDMIQLKDAEEWKESEEKKEKAKQEEAEELSGKKEVKEIPKVTVGLFIEKPTPFLQEFLDRIEELKYPKKMIDLYLHNAIEGHKETVDAWVESNTGLYASLKYIAPEEDVKEWHVRNGVIDHCLAKECGYLFVVDSEAQIMNPYTLKLLIEQNRPVVAPLLIRPYKAWSNFWGAVTLDGFYARSMDYMEIVQGQRRGLWNVPYVSGSYLVQAGVLANPRTRPAYIRNLLDPDMAFCENLREKGVFLHLSNRVEFGHLVNNEEFDLSRLNPELWEVERNRWDWERRYLNPAYPESVAENTTVEMPCPDVYWFPVFTERFAEEMIVTFEDFGVWSSGTNEPPRALMNFMVRYKPDEQPFLRPHHDTSTYTINVALNKPGKDYEGGGCRFVRYNCNVTDSRVGWVLMHPGRLTHLHEGLRTTKGTRYIIVSFVDP